MKDRPQIIDADFRVVGEAPHRQWNGLGVPPDWPTYTFGWKVFYVVGYVLYGVAVIAFAHWIGPLIVQGLRWLLR